MTTATDNGAARRCRIALLLAVMSGAAVVGLATPAYAHAELLTSDPADGARLVESPPEIVLSFNEPVSAPPEPVRVFDGAGARVDADDAGPAGGDRSRLRVSLRPDLPTGVYVVAWRAISADTHPVRGSFVFTVGEVPAGTPAPSVPPVADQTGWEVAAAAGRWLTYAGTLLAAGGIAFLVFVHDRRPTERDRLVRLVCWAVAGAVAGSIVGVPLQTVVLNGIGATALTYESLWADTLASGYGMSAALRLTALTGLLVAAVALGVTRWARPAAVAAALAALGSFLFTGHTVTSEPRSLAVVSNLSHTAAAAVWLGGLVLLAAVLHDRRRDLDAAGAAGMVARFSKLAVASVLVMTAAGAALGWVEIRSWGQLTGTPYGQTLLAKVGLVALVVGIGAYNNRRLLPAIHSGSAPAWRRLRTTLRWEGAILLVGVLALTAVLVSLVPARNLAAAPASTGPYVAAAPLGTEYQIELVVDPARAGVNELRLSLHDPAGDAVPQVQRVELRFSLPTAGIERITREPAPAGPGRWDYRGPELSIAGDWEIEVRVTVDDFERLTTIVEVPVAAGTDHHNHP